MIHISFEFKDEAWGGANQFLKSLRSEFIKLGVHTDKLNEASHVLFNSHHNMGIIQRLKTELPHLKFVHRVDGPMKLYNSPGDKRDDLVFEANNLIANATIFQSHWSKKMNILAGMKDSKPNIVIYNASDPEVFYPPPPETGKKENVKLISASFSTNINKGFQFYKYLENNLDFTGVKPSYEYSFVGRTPFPFRIIKDLGCLNSLEVAKTLRASDIYITASTNDPCSNSLIEAISCRRPCLALKSGGHTEIIKNTKSGLTFEDINDFWPKLKEVIDNYDDIESGMEPFNMSDTAKNYISFIENV